jgi:C4-dicarboxylate transporter DctM subunit
MTETVIGIIGIGVLVVTLLMEFPVGFAMALVGFIGFSYLVSPSAGLSMLAIEIFDNFSSYSLTVLPLFVFMGSIGFASGMTRRLYDAGYAVLGQRRGGLALATILACAGFASVCGSTVAAAAAMGKVAVPEMRARRYDDSLATGCVAAGGTLSPLIPPSAILIVYGIMTEQSIGKLFIAGVLPGLLLTLLFLGAIGIRCWMNPSLGPPGPPTTLRQKLAGLGGVVEMLVLFCLVIGGLFIGWFTPTQAGAIGAAGALLISLARRTISWQGFLDAARDTLLITGMTMVIVTGAMVFTRFLAVSGLPRVLVELVGGLPIPSMAIMAIIIMFHFAGGCFMDAFGLILLTIPVVFPLVLALGFDPIWFGILIVVIVEMGVITPPVGVNVYVIKGIVPDVPMGTIFRGAAYFVGSLIVFVALLMVFPQIATFLPGFMTY